MRSSPLIVFGLCLTLTPAARADEALEQRVYGMLLGSIVGDALGGPVEFAPREAVGDRLPGFSERPEVRLDAADLSRLSETLPLLPYDPIRPEAAPYGPWHAHAEAGTITDDTRHKIVVIDAVRRAGDAPLTREHLAEAYLGFAKRFEIKAVGWPALCKENFAEFLPAARWVLGERDPLRAAPPSRLWGGVGTCCGQMALPPVAGLYPGDPDGAYLAAYEIGFIDNGEAKDLNAALVAGLAHALSQPIPADTPDARHAAWRAVLDAMRRCDPLRHGETPFMRRPLEVWIEAGERAAREAGGSPERLYRLIEQHCPHEQAWEARLFLTQAVALGEFCRGEPLASVHLALDYGEDADSAAQLLGAVFGAIHGPAFFPEEMRRTVERRLREDHGESPRDWARLLTARRPVK